MTTLKKNHLRSDCEVSSTENEGEYNLSATNSYREELSSRSIDSLRNKLLEGESSGEEHLALEDIDSLLFDVSTEEIIEDLQGIIGSQEKFECLPEGVEYSKSFSKNGKQGVVGLLRLKSGKNCVWKISQHLNYIVNQENTILDSLNEMREYCPHFVRGFGKVNVKMTSDFRKVENPFKVSGRHNIYNDVLLLEHVDNARKFYRYIKNKNIEEDVLYSIVKQTLLAITFAQREKGLAHYDLHSNNILVKTCNPNSVFLYVLDENTQYCVPTYGYYPVIIDFGFGYVKNMNNNPLWGALAHTEVGFLSNMCDMWADPKLFLVTVSDEIKGYRDTKTSRKFRRIVKNIFSPLNIDWSSGWDSQDGVINCSDKVYNMIKREGKFSRFFRETGQYCIDLMQSMITLPLKKRKYRDIEDVFKMVVEEFHKIEIEISSLFYNLYIFKKMVDAARSVCDMYSVKETMNEATKRFRLSVLETIDQVAKYCKPKVDWDKLLCSLIVFSRQMEGVMYDHITPRLKEKEEEYEDMEVKNQTEIYEALEVNIPSLFVFDENTTVYVWDLHRKQSRSITLSKRFIDKINKETDTLVKSKMLYTYYTKS